MTEDKFNMLPLEIRRTILYYAIVGQEEPTLDYCRWVCRDWNEIIKRSVWQSPTKEWGVITKAMIEKSKPWVWGGFYPSHKMISHAKDLEMGGILPTGVMKTVAEGVKHNIRSNRFPSPEEASPEDMTVAASLAHLGLLGTLDRLSLRQDHLASIPSQHLASLVSCVKDQVWIDNIDNIVTILESVQSGGLIISDQCLSSGETQALLLAMETRLEKVTLTRVTVDIEALTKYSGQGRCHTLVMNGKKMYVAGVKKLSDWCKECENWNVTRDFWNVSIKCVRT